MSKTPVATRWIALGLLSAMVGACGSDDAAPRQQGTRAVDVITQPIERVEWVDVVEALGTTRARESVTITAKVTEVVDRINFEDGDLVTAGDVLVDLSGRAEVAELVEAQATYKEAQQQYTRQSGLVESGTIARSQLDTQVATRDAAKARVDAIRARLADRVITAPFDGVLGFRQVSPGTLVTPGTPIATLDDVSTIRLDFQVPETFLSVLQQGQQITARSAAWPARDFTGTVATVGSRVDPVTRSVTVRADVPNPELRLRPGMLMTVRLMQAPREALALPEIAVIQVGSTASVFRVREDNTVESIDVELGARRQGMVEIEDGLQEGDRIVIEGTVKLRSGAQIAEAPAADADAAQTAERAATPPVRSAG